MYEIIQHKKSNAISFIHQTECWTRNIQALITGANSQSTQFERNDSKINFAARVSYEASSAPAFDGSGDGRDEDESGRDLAELLREERDFGEPALEDCADLGLAVLDCCLVLPSSDFCDLPDAGLEEGDFTEAGRDDGFWPEGGRDETLCSERALSGCPASSDCLLSSSLSCFTGSGFGCCSIIVSVSPWMILWAAKTCLRWLRFTADKKRNNCFSKWIKGESF